MTSSRRPVVFDNGAGCRLMGILHEPAAARRDVGVVLLAAGVKARVGPHGLYTRLATALAEQGLSVLRFDFWGLGDSEGTAVEPLLADLYGSVSCGRFVADTVAAVTWMRQTTGVDRVVLAGLCGGAITGLLAGAGRPDVAGLMSFGLPITVDGANVDKVRYMSQGQLQGIRRRYLAKVTDPKSWVRLLSLKTDFRLLWRAVRSAGPPAQQPGGAPPSAAPPDDNSNPYFVPKFNAMLQARQPVLMVFSGADRLYWEFQERFVQRHAFDAARHADTLEIAVVKNANHIFTFPEWQHELFTIVRRWLESHFPAPADSRQAAGSRPEAAV